MAPPSLLEASVLVSGENIRGQPTDPVCTGQARSLPRRYVPQLHPQRIAHCGVAQTIVSLPEACLEIWSFFGHYKRFFTSISLRKRKRRRFPSRPIVQGLLPLALFPDATESLV